MSEEMQSHSRNVVKVGVLGDKRVGKTYLSHTLAGTSYDGYIQTTEVYHHEGKQGTNFIYIDNPPLDRQTIIQIGSVHHYDILVFLFKDCDSFTKLYQFLVAIKEVIDNCSNHHVKEYWHHLKKILLVYTDHQSQLPCQLEQLFPILKEQIEYFCKSCAIKEFAIEKGSDNWKQLKNIIEEQSVKVQINETVTSQSGDPQSVQFKRETHQQYSRQNQIEIGLSTQNQHHIHSDTQKIQHQQVQKSLSQPQHLQQSVELSQKHQQEVKVQQIIQHEQKKEQITQSEVKEQTVEHSHIDQIRKSNIYQKIRDSFNLSSIQTNQHNITQSFKQELPIKDSIAQHQDQHKDILQSFRQTTTVKDPEIDKKINQYHQQKIKKLQKDVSISDEGQHLMKEQQKHKDQKKNQKSEEKDMLIIKGPINSTQNKGKIQLKGPQSTYKQKMPKSQEVQSPSEKPCACIIM